MLTHRTIQPTDPKFYVIHSVLSITSIVSPLVVPRVCHGE